MDWLAGLAQLLRQVVVVKLRLADFQPSQGTYPGKNLDAIVAEFKVFLEAKLTQAGEADEVILEVEP